MISFVHERAPGWIVKTRLVPGASRKGLGTKLQVAQNLQARVQESHRILDDLNNNKDMLFSMDIQLSRRIPSHLHVVVFAGNFDSPPPLSGRALREARASTCVASVG